MHCQTSFSHASRITMIIAVSNLSLSCIPGRLSTKFSGMFSFNFRSSAVWVEAKSVSKSIYKLIRFRFRFKFRHNFMSIWNWVFKGHNMIVTDQMFSSLGLIWKSNPSPFFPDYCDNHRPESFRFGLQCASADAILNLDLNLTLKLNSSLHFCVCNLISHLSLNLHLNLS